MQRRRAVLLLTTTIAAVAAPRRARAQSELPKIRIVGPLTEDLTNVFYAVKTGGFRRAGLDVELVAANNGAAATAAVLAGTYEIAKTGMLAIFAAHLRDIPIVAVAPSLLFTSRNPWGRLQIAPDSPFKTGADLNGKTMGVPSLNDLATLTIKAWVDKNGGDWRSLKFVEIPNSAIDASLAQHRIDAAILQQPQLDASLAAGSTKTLGDAYGAVAPSFLTGALIARGDWVKQSADVLKRFDRVYADSAAYVGSHPAETASYVAELTKIQMGDVVRMHRSIIPTALEAVQIQPVIDAAARYELIARSFSARELLPG